MIADELVTPADPFIRRPVKHGSDKTIAGKVQNGGSMGPGFRRDDS